MLKFPRRKLTQVVALLLTSIALSGCPGSPAHLGVKYTFMKRTISNNNENLLKLNVGMSGAEVKANLGNPERSEAYEWGTVLLYRTAMTSGVYGTQDTDFTPVVIGKDGKLEGWGRNFYISRAKKYDITVKHR